jgi:hypothetical protein
MNSKNISRNEALILIAVVLFVLSLFIFACKKDNPQPQPNPSMLGTWVIDTIIVNAPALSYDELILVPDTLTITADSVFYSSVLAQGYTYKPNKLKFTPATEYHPANAVIYERTATRMVWDTNEKHRRIRRILRKI